MGFHVPFFASFNGILCVRGPTHNAWGKASKKKIQLTWEVGTSSCNKDIIYQLLLNCRFIKLDNVVDGLGDTGLVQTWL